MQFGQAVGTACGSFAITNIDDIFVLVTFFAEAASKKTTTPLKITLGQYLGFTAIIVISMIGFGASLLLPSEPIGFLGLLPALLGVWHLLGLLLPQQEEEEETSRLDGFRSILKVAMITVMNGGDNIGTYIPLFSQAEGAEIAVYIVAYYILLGIWCLAAFLVMKQRHVLLVAERYAHLVVPLLYVGLGVYIMVKSECYPWSIERIDAAVSTRPGRAIMATMTTFFLLVCIGTMLWIKWRKRRARRMPDAGIDLEEHPSSAADSTADGSHNPARP